VKVPDPVDGSSEVPRVATRAKAMEGGGERPGSRDIDWIPSRAGRTCRSDVGREPPRRRASATSDGRAGLLLTQRLGPPAISRKEAVPTPASLAPEGHANHFRPSLPPSS
jgi:hypothetical protein